MGLVLWMASARIRRRQLVRIVQNDLSSLGHFGYFTANLSNAKLPYFADRQRYRVFPCTPHVAKPNLRARLAAG